MMKTIPKPFLRSDFLFCGDNLRARDVCSRQTAQSIANVMGTRALAHPLSPPICQQLNKYGLTTQKDPLDLSRTVDLATGRNAVLRCIEKCVEISTFKKTVSREYLSVCELFVIVFQGEKIKIK